ncbi:MAG: hypothetical protein ACRDTE_01840 [Pseudonocardiaceae bacterium]
MRYTLRLLTIQQFERATTLIYAAEVLRRADPSTWDDLPFRIGYLQYPCCRIARR